MIKAKDAIAEARKLLGTPYSEMDCIALIRAVIKRAAGGVKNYRCEGTNWLWKSIDNSDKYRHLIWRQESTDGACEGMLAFKRRDDDVHHVGIVTDIGTVIHSSSVRGMVIESALDDTWHLLGRHRYISTGGPTQMQSTQAEEQESTGSVEAADEIKSMTVLINREDGYVIRLDGDWRIAQD